MGGIAGSLAYQSEDDFDSSIQIEGSELDESGTLVANDLI